MSPAKETKAAKKEAKRLEKLKKEIELRRKLKRDELQRELAAQTLRRDELDQSWREMMLKIKEPVFRKDIEVMWHIFERLYDRKDYIIGYIMKLREIADDQFQRTVASFCVTIDNTISKFLEELDEIDKVNTKKTAEVLKRGEEELAMVAQSHQAQETHLQLLLYFGHRTADTLAWTKRGENLVKLDEERSKFLDERENLVSYLENLYSSYWEQYKAVLKSYIVGTAENQKMVRKLRRKENVMADIIAAQAKKIGNNDSMLKHLRVELLSYESGSKQAVFRERRDRHRNACFTLKQKMEDGVENDRRKLNLLVNETDTAVEWLEVASQKVEKILKLAALCRKFETRKEKVLPFNLSKPHSQTQTKSHSRRQHESDDNILVTNAMAATSGLTRLWHRIAKAELTKKALEREKLLLERENEYIEAKIEEFNEKQYFPDTTNCICTKPKTISAVKSVKDTATSKISVRYPVAIDAVYEASKLGLVSRRFDFD